MNIEKSSIARQALLLPWLVLAAWPCAALEADEVFDRASPSVWGVLTVDQKSAPMSRGSAVVIAPGRLITNCHVVDKAKAVWVRRENVMYGAEVELRDGARDLCQLKVANFSAPAVTIAPLDAVRVGGKAYAIGNPRGLENTLSDGLVSGVRRGKDGGVEAIQTSAPISPGSSGGGLFDAQGRLVGITTFSLRDSQSLNFAVPAVWILDLAQRTAAATTSAANSPRGGTPGSRPGDTYEYALTDLTTGVPRRVQYRIDRMEFDRILFNQGDRIETPDGEVLAVGAGIAGEFDTATPPRGWVRRGAAAGESWSFSYSSTDGGNVSAYELTGRVAGTETVKVPAGEFATTVYRYDGYLSRSPAGTAPARARYAATVWYADDLRRVVRFEVRSRSATNFGISTFQINERLELVRLPGD